MDENSDIYTIAGKANKLKLYKEVKRRIKI